MPIFVLDCSVTMAWCFEDEACSYSDNVLMSLKNYKNRALVPSLWKLEVTNVLLMAERKKRILEADMLHFIRFLKQLPLDIEKDNDSVSMGDLVLIGKTHQLTAYDACYLHMAISLGLPLATVDKRLEEAAKQAGVSIYHAG